MSLLEFRVLNENDSRCPFGDGSERLDVSLGQSHLHSGCLVPGRDVRDGEDRSSLADDELRIQVPYCVARAHVTLQGYVLYARVSDPPYRTPIHYGPPYQHLIDIQISRIPFCDLCVEFHLFPLTRGFL